MKAVCSRHERAYEVGVGCPYCEPLETKAKAIESSTATAPKRCKECKSTDIAYQQGCSLCTNCGYTSGLLSKLYSFTHDYVTYELPVVKDVGLYLKYSKQLTEALDEYRIKNYLEYRDAFTPRLFSADVRISKTEKWTSVSTKLNYEKFKVDASTLESADGLPSTAQELARHCKAVSYQIQGTASDALALSLVGTEEKNLPLSYADHCSKQADLVWKWHTPGGDSLKFEPITTLRMIKKRGE